ncbi:tyrosine-type recombinase/integrase [Flavisphingopyxis soli]|nr:tyrosine-type recombinase/integrase [Sphingorhabdus soli]
MIETKWGEVPLAVFNDPRMKAKVFAWRDSRRNTPRAADIGVTVLRALLKFGVQRGRLTINMAADIPAIYRNGQRADIVWLSDDLERFASVANAAVIDAVRLACLTGLRCADLADLRWNEVGDKAIIRMAQKASKGKRRRAMVSMTAGLQSLLQELRARRRKVDVDTVLVTSEGNSWSPGGLGKRVGEASKKAGIIHSDGRKKHLHDCRGTYATHLMIAGATDQEIARAMAWSPEKVADIRLVYVDQARTVVALGERLAAKAVN